MKYKYWTIGEERLLKRIAKKYKTRKGIDWSAVTKELKKQGVRRSTKSIKNKYHRIKNISLRTTKRTKTKVKPKKQRIKKAKTRVKPKKQKTKKIKTEKLKIKIGRKYVTATDSVKVKTKRKKSIKTISKKIKRRTKKKRAIKKLKNIYEKERKKRLNEIEKHEKKEVKKQKQIIQKQKKEEITEKWIKLNVVGHIDDYGKSGHAIWLKARVSVTIPESDVQTYKQRAIKEIIDRITNYFGYADFIQTMTFGYETEPTNKREYTHETEFKYSHNGTTWQSF